MFTGLYRLKLSGGVSIEFSIIYITSLSYLDYAIEDRVVKKIK